MTTHLWNSDFASHEYVRLTGFYERRGMCIIRSLANEDGVFDLDDLATECPEFRDLGFQPDRLELILNSLLRQDGRYTTADLRHELKFYEPARESEWEDDQPTDSGNDDSSSPSEPTAQAEQQSAKSLHVSKIAVVSIDNIRIYLPDDINIDDEDAVSEYVRKNLRRVREAAAECNPEDVTVTDAIREKVQA